MSVEAQTVACQGQPEGFRSTGCRLKPSGTTGPTPRPTWLMNVRTHNELVGLIWNTCNLLRGPYKRSEYRKVILPAHSDPAFRLRSRSHPRTRCWPSPTRNPHQTGTVRDRLLREASQKQFYNTSRLTFERLLDNPNHLARDLNIYLRGFSENIRDILDRFRFRPTHRSHGRTQPAVPSHQGLRRC